MVKTGERVDENESIEVIAEIDEQEDDDDEDDESQPNCMLFGDDQGVFYVPFDSVMNEIANITKGINREERKHSDVVPGVYEGMSSSHDKTKRRHLQIL